MTGWFCGEQSFGTDNSAVLHVINRAVPGLPETQQLCRRAVGVNDVQQALRLTSPVGTATNVRLVTRQQTRQTYMEAVTVPNLNMFDYLNTWRKTVVTTFTTCLYTVQNVVTNRKLRCRTYINSEHV